jgi:hypothetical protein
VLNQQGAFFVGVRNEGGFVGDIDFGEEIERNLFNKVGFITILT